MNKCNFHQQNDAKRICIKCKKAFCDECAKQTDYTGRCIDCELKHIESTAKLCTKKQIGYLSSFFACVIGAIVFLVFYSLFNDFKLVGKFGAILLGIFSFLFGLLAVENGFKLKRLKIISKKIKDYCKLNEQK